MKDRLYLGNFFLFLCETLSIASSTLMLMGTGPYFGIIVMNFVL